MTANKLTCFVLLLVTVSPALAAQKELTQTDQFPAADGKTVFVDAATLDVRLRAADVRSIEVATELRIAGVSEERAASWIVDHTPQFSDDVSRLEVSARPGRQGFLWLGLLTARARIGLVVPPTVIPDITTTAGNVAIRGDFASATPLRLRTATGQIELNGAAGSLDVRSASGDATVDVLRPLDRLFARTSSGDVTLTGGAREVKVDTASGDVRLTDLSGPAEVTTSTGKVFLSWDRLDPDATVTVRSASGRIHLALPEGLRPRGTLTTTAGTIRSDLPGTVNEAGDTVTLQGDGPLLQIETASGEITVGTGDDWSPAQTTPSPSP